MISKWRVWRRVLLSWVHTVAAFAVLLVLLCVVALISIRFGGFRFVYRMMFALVAFSFVTFLLSEVLVNMILGVEKPDRERHSQFIKIMRDLCREVGIIYQPTPRLYIIKMEQPNAVAYGCGVLGQYAVGITQSLYDMLSEAELKAVLAHELAHIRSRDVGIATVTNILTNGGSWLSLWLFRLGFGPMGFLFGGLVWILSKLIFPVGQRVISQQREYSADALSALYTGEVESMKSALRKLSGGRTDHERKSIFDDLFFSHPFVDDRIESLDNLVVKPQLVTEKV